jgi:hypothetical protein
MMEAATLLSDDVKPTTLQNYLTNFNQPCFCNKLGLMFDSGEPTVCSNDQRTVDATTEPPDTKSKGADDCTLPVVRLRQHDLMKRRHAAD